MEDKKRWTVVITNGQINLCTDASNMEVGVSPNSIIMNVYNVSQDEAVKVAKEIYGQPKGPA